MGKWIILMIGVLLSANGFYTRTYDFPNDTPVKYCFTWTTSASTAASTTQLPRCFWLGGRS